MAKQVPMLIRLDEELHKMAKKKCKEQFNIGLAPLIKIFLKAFVTQNGVGFYVGDEDLCRLFNRWLNRKRAEKYAPRAPGPRLKDIYELQTELMRKFHHSKVCSKCSGDIDSKGLL